MRDRLSRAARLAFLVLVIASQTGCILAPAIDSFKRAGMTQSDRMRLLGERIKEFNESLKWGDPQLPLQYIDESSLNEVRPIIERMVEQEKVVEMKVVSSAFSDDGYEATVRLKVKSFKIPYYIVNERMDEQQWRFGMSSGWQLLSIKSGVS